MRKSIPLDVQGHRGARGLRPENTTAGFAHALALGVDTIETDLLVTRDDVVVCAHDPALNPAITRGPDGRWLEGPTPLVRALTLAELQRYDVGRIAPGTAYAQRFPEQVPVDGARIPALTDLLELARAHATAPRLNLEIKTSPLAPGETAPPEHVVSLVIDAVRRAGMAERVTLQSFDWRCVLASRSLAPEIATNCLTMRDLELDSLAPVEGRPSPWLGGLDPALFGHCVPRLVAATGSTAWAPYFSNLDAATLAQAHALGLKVIPWTVNEPADMTRFVTMGVDGLITDYPDRARRVLDQG